MSCWPQCMHDNLLKMHGFCWVLHAQLYPSVKIDAKLYPSVKIDRENPS